MDVFREVQVHFGSSHHVYWVLQEEVDLVPGVGEALHVPDSCGLQSVAAGFNVLH